MLQNALKTNFNDASWREKRKAGNVSLNEPIGMDKEGNTINLLDVVEMDDQGR